jgi:hypothetical protein
VKHEDFAQLKQRSLHLESILSSISLTTDEVDQIDSQAQLLLSQCIFSCGSAAGILGDGTETDLMDAQDCVDEVDQLDNPPPALTICSAIEILYDWFHTWTDKSGTSAAQSSLSTRFTAYIAVMLLYWCSLFLSRGSEAFLSRGRDH